MRRQVALLALASGVVSTGCISGFRHPLGPVDEAFIDAQLTGRWSCTTPDDPAPARLTIVDFDGRQYYLEFLEHGKRDPERLRGHATRLEGVPFLSLRSLGTDDEGDWNILEYQLAERGRLALRTVAAEPFEDVIDDPDRVRERLAGRLDDPAIVAQATLTCRRSQDAR